MHSQIGHFLETHDLNKMKSLDKYDFQIYLCYECHTPNISPRILNKLSCTESSFLSSWAKGWWLLNPVLCLRSPFPCGGTQGLSSSLLRRGSAPGVPRVLFLCHVGTCALYLETHSHSILGNWCLLLLWKDPPLHFLFSFWLPRG